MAIYKLFDVPEDLFDDCVEKILNNKYIYGFNITTPYKDKIIDFSDGKSDIVKVTNSCNIMVKKNNRFYAFNTDGKGFLYGYKNIISKSKKILILGCGATARSIAYEILKKKKKVFIVNRTVEKMTEFSKNLRVNFKKNIYFYKLDEIKEVMEPDIIINATSCTKYNIFPWKIPSCWNKDIFIIDCNYWLGGKTYFLQKFYNMGYNNLYDGKRMLYFQAKFAQKIWERIV